MKKSLIDHVEFRVKAGNGGGGLVHFRREKYIPKGGPDGGDGGNGGSIYFVTNQHMTTLMDFMGKTEFEADHGGKGKFAHQHGNDAENITLEVPVGTVVWQKKVDKAEKYPEAELPPELLRSRAKKKVVAADVLTDEWSILADMNQPGMKVLVAHGGAGGRGNDYFKSSINTTPRYAEPGRPGEEKNLKLEMKILADIGLVGLPNAGKSTLLSVLTNARPEIANYPFTTVTPNLGVMSISAEATELRSYEEMSKTDSETPKLRNSETLVVADIPGLIEDAHKGKGLGVEFLRHIERCQTLLYVISPTDMDLLQLDDEKFDLAESLWNQFQIVLKEVTEYGNGAGDKAKMVVLNKIDLLSEESVNQIKEFFEDKGEKLTSISAANTNGLVEFKDVLATLVN